MILRAALLGAGFGLAGCSAWQGGVTAVAPVTVADARLEPVAPTGVAPVAAAAPEGSTGAVATLGQSAVTQGARGSFAVVPASVATAELQPVAGSGSTAVTPVAASGATGLVPAAAALSTGNAVAAGR